MSSAEPEVDLLSSIELGEAPRRILEFAARGFVPLPPSELVRAVGTILASEDPELCPLAEETFRGFSAEDLKASVLSDKVRPEQLDVIARRTTSESVLEPLIRHHSVSDATLSWLAERLPPFLQDVLVTNQTRLLACPEIVERLFENTLLSSDIRRRADEFLEEFFLKKIREEHEAELERLRAEVIAQAKTEAEKEAALAELARKEADLDGLSELAPVSEDEKKSLLARIATMTVVQRIRLAWRGNKEERLYLIRDTNRLVTAAVLKSPKTREADAETIANLKSVSEDVLRGITFRKEWMRKYGVMSAIIKNPRAPIDVTLPLIIKLNLKDLKLLSLDKNIPDAVRATARREVQRKQP
ncbi:MAG: hypothetical protein ABIT01_18095 [Thermoanaerobaculia bacterium]